MELSTNTTRIAIIGLGYVGLPLAAAFAKKYPVVGFDINEDRILSLRKNIDHTLELNEQELESINLTQPQGIGLFVTNELSHLNDSNVFIITVPTPTDKHNHPDLTPLYKASETVARSLNQGNIVIYESTVYPGVTEDECVPILESVSGLTYNVDFFAGYSPERINPGDKEHTVTKILKVTSGSTQEVAEFVDQLYKSIIVAGTFKASSIKVAEAAKVIENSQRDINIAFVNELSKIFNLLDIDTHDVLAAAGTKWNFLNFKPGLVGGHCIGVDPYYLAQKAQEVGYLPEIILAGRRLNDSMGKYVAQEVIKLMIKKSIAIKGARVLILGFTFKENCPDVRNTKVIDIIKEMQTYSTEVSVYDPWAKPDVVFKEYQLRTFNEIKQVSDQRYEAVILAVGHEQFMQLNLNEYKASSCVVYDVKGVLGITEIDSRL
jgi:UDP-N-acetyl-D-galactosamine dehydrogenase